MSVSKKSIFVVSHIVSGKSWHVGRDKNGNLVLSLYITGNTEPLRLHLSHNMENTIWQFCHEQTQTSLSNFKENGND